MQFADMTSYTDPVGAKIFKAKDITSGIARYRAEAVSAFIAGQPQMTMSFRPASQKTPINKYRVSGRFPTVDSNGILLRSQQFDLDLRLPETGTFAERQQLMLMISYAASLSSTYLGSAIAATEGVY